ncbi:hypothetical protein N2152v2_002046 [Parachlorella kessleri]
MALEQLRRRLASVPYEMPKDATLQWYLLDRGFDVEEAYHKLVTMLRWRREFGADNITLTDVAREAATGKALLHSHYDRQGRPVILVRVAKHVIGQSPLVESQRLCVHIIDRALEQLEAEGWQQQTVLGIFDLRGFSSRNGDLAFVRFMVDCFFIYYPKRLSQVLLVDAPWVFRPGWEVVRPWLGKYSALVRFVTADEAEAPSAWRQEEVSDEDSELYHSDDFRMCGEKAARRDPRTHEYTGIACPEMKKQGTCLRGESCPYAHNVFEYWLHPTRYRTQLCNDGPGCSRSICFFAHNLDELRTPAIKPYVSPEALARSSLAAIRQNPHPLAQLVPPPFGAPAGGPGPQGAARGSRAVAWGLNAPIGRPRGTRPDTRDAVGSSGLPPPFAVMMQQLPAAAMQQQGWRGGGSGQQQRMPASPRAAAGGSQPDAILLASNPMASAAAGFPGVFPGAMCQPAWLSEGMAGEGGSGGGAAGTAWMTSPIPMMTWAPEAGPPTPASTPRLSATAPAAGHALGWPFPVVPPQAPPASLATLSVPALHASRSAGRISGGRPAAFPTTGACADPAAGATDAAAGRNGRQSQGSGHAGSRPATPAYVGGCEQASASAGAGAGERLMLGVPASGVSTTPGQAEHAVPAGAAQHGTASPSSVSTDDLAHSLATLKMALTQQTLASSAATNHDVVLQTLHQVLMDAAGQSNAPSHRQ